MTYDKNWKNGKVCLECGDSIDYGRVNRKFCCDECKDKYHYRMQRNYRSVRLRVVNALNKNHEILDKLIGMSVFSIDLGDLAQLGFTSTYATACRKAGCHMEYRCFDIKYHMSDRRVFSIERVPGPCELQSSL